MFHFYSTIPYWDIVNDNILNIWILIFSNEHCKCKYELHLSLFLKCYFWCSSKLKVFFTLFFNVKIYTLYINKLHYYNYRLCCWWFFSVNNQRHLYQTLQQILRDGPVLDEKTAVLCCCRDERYSYLKTLVQVILQVI